MNTLVLILLFNFIGSIISLVGGILLLFRRDFAYKISHILSSFAAGTLLGTVFFDLLPESLDLAGQLRIDNSFVFSWTLSGALFFFILERFLHWFHHHSFEEHEIKGKPIVPLMIIGDTIHNFIDGVAIAATFIANVPLGIITTFAVGAHEIPQEIGDFGVMLKNKMSRKKVLTVNIVSALASFLGAVFAYYYGSRIESLSVIFLSLTSGFFLYISLSDLIPEIHHENKKGLAIRETLALLMGVLTIFIALFVIEKIFNIHP